MQEQKSRVLSPSTFLGGYTVFAVSVVALLTAAAKTLPYEFFEEMSVVIVPPLFYAALRYPPGVHRLCIVIVALIIAMIVYITSGGDGIDVEEYYTIAACLALIAVTAEFVYRSVHKRRKDDIKRTRAEEKLRESEERFRFLFESSSDCVIILDRELNYIHANKPANEYLGMKNESIEGKNIREALAAFPDFLDVWIKRLADYFETGQPAWVEDSISIGDEVRWSESSLSPIQDAAGQIVAVGIIYRDITERKLAEELLKASEERHRTYVENAPEGIFIVDFSGRYLDVNSAACEMTGYSRDELLAMSIPELTSPDAPPETLATFESLKRTGKVRTEVLIRRKDGVDVHILLKAIALSDERYMAFCSDITEQKQLEDQLRQAQKMEAVGQLAGGVAHDFNNILQGIMGYTEMAMSNLSPSDRAYQDMEQVEKGSERAATLTRQLLAFSRRQMIQPVNLDLNKVITDISRMLRRVIGEHIELDLKLHADTGTVHADSGAMEQVLLNLCVNGRDAMPGGGDLVIETGRVILDDTFCQAHAWATPGNYAHVAVTDSGAGMPPHIVERIFEPFFTTKETGKGTGLGLSMVYGIVRQHEGLIHCYSEPGQGTCLKIYLPSTEHAAKPEDKKEDSSQPVRGTETILLAEDDEIVRNLTVLALEQSGYRVHVAENGEEALRLFEEHREEVQLALLDVVMPKIGGREVYDAIRALRPDLPVLFSSGYSTNAIHAGFVAEEGLEIIQKPYSPTALLRRMREALDGR